MTDVPDVTAAGRGTLFTVVNEYYRRIDDRDVGAALSCFASDAIYRRPGYATFVGLRAIYSFYRVDRVIADGRHELESVVVDDMTVAVRGEFRGRSRDGDRLELRFADFWRFSGLLVVERETYFDAAVV